MKPMQDWPIKPAGVAYVIASMFARSPALQDTGVVVLPHLHTPCSVLICEEETQPPTSHRMQKHLMRQLIVHFPPHCVLHPTVKWTVYTIGPKADAVFV